MNEHRPSNHWNGNGGPWWIKAIATFGLPAFLLMWLLGAIPFVPSPLTLRLEAHDKSSRYVMALICKGVWKDNQWMQQECEKAMRDGER